MAIKNYEDYILYLESDLASRKLDRWKREDKVLKPELYFTRALRKTEYLRTKRSDSKIAEFKYVKQYRKTKKIGTRLGISIHPGCFGPGLRITHCGSVIVHGKARIGKNCELGGAVSIGINAGGVPKIGDNVYVGPGSVVFGNIKVGDNVIIGANSVVNKDIPANSVVAGAPARILKTTNKLKVIKGYEEALKRMVKKDHRKFFRLNKSHHKKVKNKSRENLRNEHLYVNSNSDFYKVVQSINKKGLYTFYCHGKAKNSPMSNKSIRGTVFVTTLTTKGVAASAEIRCQDFGGVVWNNYYDVNTTEKWIGWSNPGGAYAVPAGNRFNPFVANPGVYETISEINSPLNDNSVKIYTITRGYTSGRLIYCNYSDTGFIYVGNVKVNGTFTGWNKISFIEKDI